MDRDEIREEIEQIERDCPDEEGRMETLIDFVQLVAGDARDRRAAGRPAESQRATPEEPELANEQEFLIAVHEAIACAVNEVPAKHAPNISDAAVRKMAPYVAAWLLEDFDIIEKE